jgi:hypothetical protein
MSALVDRSPTVADGATVPHPARPVLLATLGVRVDPAAEQMALESAAEAGVKLILANVSMMPPYPATMMLAREYVTLPHEEDLDAVRATAERARRLGISTELLRVTTRRPIKAVLELASDYDAGLLVFGPDLGRVGRLRFRTAARAVRRGAPCLVWIAKWPDL